MRSAVALLLGLLGACSKPEARPGSIEIGSRVSGRFEAAPTTTTTPMLLDHINGIDYLTLAVRVPSIASGTADVAIELTAGERVVGSGPGGTPDPLQEPFVPVDEILWDVEAFFQIRTCCVNCREIEIRAEITDASGALFGGTTRVLPSLNRDPCPIPTVCCDSAAECPAEAPAEICRD